MGKKLKGGRRQILQLEEKKPPKTVSKPKMKSLIHYSDSDDDSKISNESESSIKVQASKDATPMDSEIADFFKEIDALTVPEELCEPSNPSPTENEPEDSKAPDSFPQHEDTDLPQNKVDCHIEEQKEEMPCSWQEIPDESTGYSYYWNMHTNEVTWDCPEEYAKYVQSMNAKLQAEDKTTEATSKKTKRKKEPEKLPEGAIIPISYYGSSSSDNSSDSENESPKPVKKQKIEQSIIPKKTKASRKKDRKKASHKTDIIGPQLPPDFLVEPSESAVYGPSLPPNYGDVLKENALSESSSVSMDVCLPETSNESTLKSAQKNINTKEIGSLPLHKAANSVTPKNTRAFGLKAVVDYGSFTDEDDEDESNNATSPNHTEPLTPETKIEEYNTSKEIEKSVTILKGDDTEKKTVSSMVASAKIDKPNITADSKGSLKKPKDLESLPTDAKRTDVDIDSIFAAHSSYGKHGFGFGFREHSDEETEVYSSPSRQERKSYRSQTDIKPMSFVKSTSVLELGSLNEVTESETGKCDIVDEVVPSSESKTLEIEVTEDQCPSPEISSQVAEKVIEDHSQVSDEGHPVVIAETSDGCLKIAEDDVQMHSNEEAVVSKVESSEGCSDEVLKVIEAAAEDSKRSNEEPKELGELSSSDSSSSFELTDDLDEIDKALCEALDKKKAKNKASIPLDKPLTEMKENKIDSTDVKPLQKLKNTEESVLEPKEDSASKERIMEMTSVLTDKLTFLLSNSTSTLQSLNSLYIQLQTRFVDWQANALDSVYFEARLKEVDVYLHQYETGVVSGNWTCQWDRTNKRYFYLNIITQASQWTFPEELLCPANPASDPPKVDLTVTTEKNVPLKMVSSNQDLEGAASPPPPPPGVDSPPPPPPPPPSPPPIPPQSVAEREPEDMDLEDSSDSSLPGMSPMQTFVVQTNAGAFSSVSSPTTKQRTLFPILVTDSESKPNPGNTFGPEFSTPIHPTEDIPNTASSSLEVSTMPEVGSSQQKASSKPAKKKKTKIQPGLGLRKKNIPSLVEKWQKIKEEQERETSNSNEPKPPF